MLMLRCSWPLLALLTACGSTLKDPPNSQNQPIQQQRTDVEFAQQYQVSDLACQSGNQVTTIGTVPLTFFVNGQSQVEPKAFTDTSSAAALTGPGVNISYYNFYQTEACSDPNDDSTCGSPTVVQSPTNLKVCRPNGPYDRTSVEAVGLTSLANISAAFAFYGTLPNKSAALSTAQLLVLPTVEKTYDGGTERSVVTDNLAYAADFGGTPVFVIYPKGAQAAADGLWKNLNFWEMPWGLAHEFGHHVFHTHSQISSQTSGLDGAWPIHSFGKTNALAGGHTGTDVLGAVNEGFADTYAFYVYGAKAGLIQGVDCLDVNRDVAAPSFADGEPKVLTAEVLATFFSATPVATSDCNTPDFQDIHAVGAIFAHAVDRIFASQAGADAGARAQLLIKYAEAIGNTVRATGEANLTFDLLAKDALTTVADASGKLPADACAAVKELFPEYQTQLIGAGSGLTCPN